MPKIEGFAPRLLTEEDGAVTVDWVVLCAAVVALAVAVGSAVQGQLTAEAGKMGSRISAGVDG